MTPPGPDTVRRPTRSTGPCWPGWPTLVDEATVGLRGLRLRPGARAHRGVLLAFCDDYVELVKGRAYGEPGRRRRSARAALELALSTLLRLFAPFLPFVTEEVWSWWQEGSVHRAPWPDPTEAVMAAADGDPMVTEVASAALGEIRKAKTEAGASLRAEVDTVVVRDTPERLAALQPAVDDLRDAAKAAQLTTEEGDTFSVDVTLTAQPAEG